MNYYRSQEGSLEIGETQLKQSPENLERFKQLAQRTSVNGHSKEY